MKAVIQRVSKAQVTVKGKICGKIDKGLLILLGIYECDTEREMKIVADKTAKLRIFTDENDKMNLSILDFTNTEEPYSLLVVSQFTLCGNCKKGNRPEFLSAAKPEIANKLYEKFVEYLRNEYALRVETGIFRAHMEVSLTNDGPVTIILDSDKL